MWYFLILVLCGFCGPISLLLMLHHLGGRGGRLRLRCPVMKGVKVDRVTRGLN